MTFRLRSAVALALPLGLAAAPPELVTRLKADVAAFAAPELQGRGDGQEGLDRAARLALERFRAMGLEARIQEVPYGLPRRGRLEARLLEGGKAQVLAAGRDLDLFDGEVALRLSGAPLLYVGYGLSLPAHDDLKGLDLKGRVVVMEAWPRTEAMEALVVEGGVDIPRAAEGLAARGAVLVLLLQERLHGEPGRLGGATSCPAGLLRRGGLPGRAGEALAEAARALAPGRPASRELPVALDLDAKQDLMPHPLPNVVATLPGSDPRLRDEHVVVGAHLDHLGARDGRVYPGADDNASGCAGVLEIARQAARSPGRRSMSFVLFGGEEEGFLGSAFWVEHPTVPLARVKAMVNLDCIGRFDPQRELVLTGLGVEPGALARLRGLAPGALKVAVDRGTTPFAYLSDHASFAAAGIPSFFFFTGVHGDLHHPNDTPDRLNAEAMGDITEFALRLVRDQADAPQALRFEARPSLAFEPESSKSLRVRRVGGGPAAGPGLRPGDLLVAVDGQLVSNREELERALAPRRVGECVELRWVRDGREQRGSAVLVAAEMPH